MTDPIPTRTGTIGFLPAVGVFAVAVAFLGLGMPGEPRFVDEAAFVSQTYFWDLATSGRVNDPLWLEYPAYDLPPLPKYLMGAALQAGGMARVGRSWAIAWYGNLHEARFLSEAMLRAARWPSVLLGGAGCVAVFALGTMAGDRRVGLLAASLLLINPLYRLHARRAMADVPAEALLLATAAWGLLLWRRSFSGRLSLGRAVLGGLGVGAAGGLAVLAKLNGGLGLMILAAWAALDLALPGPKLRPRRRFLTSFCASAIGSVLLFSMLNPFVYARPERLPAYPLFEPVPPSQPPWTRLARIVGHRFAVPRNQQVLFPHNALTTPQDKAMALAVQGFGRFGPFGPAHSDSTRRFDWSQDRGACLWGPWVVAGCVWSFERGRSQLKGHLAPTAWAVGLQFLVAIVTVGAFLPLAWDRYFLSIQAGSALVAAGVAVAAFDALRARVRGT